MLQSFATTLTVVSIPTLRSPRQNPRKIYELKIQCLKLEHRVNSKLRTAQYIKKHVSQEYLWLLAVKHNVQPFAHGKRQGHSPFELLGVDLGTNNWIDLVQNYQP